MSYGYSQGHGGGRPQQGGYGQGGYGGGGGGGYGGYGGGGGGYGGGGGGYGGGGGDGRPHQNTHGSVDQNLYQWFASVDRDGSGHINPVELQQALVNGDWTPFELDTVKLLMNMFDTDRNGSITFNEFAGLWKYVQDWQNVFRTFDQDRSGTIDQGELSRALSSFGYNLNPRLLQTVVRKFVTSSSPSSSSTPANHRNTITFDRFVRCCVVIKTLTDSFVQRDTQRTGRITLTYDDFMDMCLSAP